MTTMRALFSVLVVVLSLIATGVMAQERSSRTLFEFLFGSDEPQTQQQAPPATRPQPQPQQQRPRPQPQPQQQQAPRPAPQPAEPAVEKSENAERIVVFGDSLAVDIARALERLYGDNPDVVVDEEAEGSSGFVRDDYFDWNRKIEDEVFADSFDVAVVAIGINDRQELDGAEPLSDAWRQTYRARLDAFLGTITGAGKQVVWIELPPMRQQSYSAALSQISSIHREAVNAAGGEWVETFERYMGEDGGYASDGPDLNGNIVSMRRDDGIHFSSSGADKLAFYIDRALGEGGGTRVSTSGSRSEVVDHLAGTDAGAMIRPPFQGLEQMRLVEMASIVQDLGTNARASELISSGMQTGGMQAFDLEDMLAAPVGRVDAFGVGISGDGVENPSGR